MSRRRRHRRPVAGSAPGQLFRDPEAASTRIKVIAYGPDTMLERDVTDPAELQEIVATHAVTWIDVCGLGDVDVIEKIGAIFGLHQLALEDVTHLYQRAKVEDYGAQLFINARMAEVSSARTEQLSLFLGKGTVVTFQERPGDNFDGVRQRIRGERPNIRKGGSDYLTYALLDAVIDGYFPCLERYGDVLEEIEDTILDNPVPETMARIQHIKRELLSFRRALWPHREMINALIRDESEHFTDKTRTFLRDAYDHVIQSVELLESYREVASGLVDLYLSSVSNRMNEVMKVLTIIATIFIPLGFIAGLYGMNFDPEVSPLNMPELSWYWGYPMALGLMAVLAGGMLLWFRRRGWLGG